MRVFIRLQVNRFRLCVCVCVLCVRACESMFVRVCVRACGDKTERCETSGDHQKHMGGTWATYRAVPMMRLSCTVGKARSTSISNGSALPHRDHGRAIRPAQREVVAPKLSRERERVGGVPLLASRAQVDDRTNARALDPPPAHRSTFIIIINIIIIKKYLFRRFIYIFCRLF